MGQESMDGVLCDKYKIDATGSQYAASTLATGTLIWINASNRRPVKAQADRSIGRGRGPLYIL